MQSVKNQTFIEILYGHAKYIKDNCQRFEFKIIINHMYPNYFQRLNSAMHQAKKYIMDVIIIFSEYIKSNDDVFCIVDIALFILKRTSNQ